MIINHNISAMNANRMFAGNVTKMEKNMVALSSGERINKGADDAAGLAVSEKMRAQIRGLNQASRNIQDASSLVQTTEGFLKESSDVLQRMRELSVQAANGTYTQEDRAQINVEIDEMVKELNRIHEDAKFNTLRLLDGKTLGLNSFAKADGTLGASRNVNFNETAAGQTQGGGKNGLVVQAGANTDERMFVKMDTFNTYALGMTTEPGATYSANQGQAWRERSFYTPTAIDVDKAMYLEAAIDAPAATVNIEYLAAQDKNRVNLATSEKATETITVLDVALNKVNKQRADLGAFQNRLEKAQGGVDNAAENLQAAESRIRDTDMAKEYVEFTKNQILSNSSASMTAQANMRSQLIMKILG